MHSYVEFFFVFLTGVNLIFTHVKRLEFQITQIKFTHVKQNWSFQSLKLEGKSKNENKGQWFHFLCIFFEGPFFVYSEGDSISSFFHNKDGFIY